MGTFKDFMDVSLYGPEGYYASGKARSGRDGDFFTAPETGAAFAQLLSLIFRPWHPRFGITPVHFLEVGAGEGKLAERLQPLLPEYLYAAVEKSPQRRQEALKRSPTLAVHADLADISSGSLRGILFANELIDAFPVHRVRMHQGVLEELMVEGREPGAEGRERVTFHWAKALNPKVAEYFQRVGIELPEGYQTEVNLAMREWIVQAARVFEQGVIVLIDYGRPAWDYYAPERSDGTLRCFQKHQVIDPFGTRNGECGMRNDEGGIKNEMNSDVIPNSAFRIPYSDMDWTADVDFTSLALDAREAGLSVLAFMEMGAFLQCGMRNVEFGMWNAEFGIRNNIANNQPTLSSSTPNSTFRIPHSALTYLLHPDGLGAQFHVLVLGKGVDPTQWTFAHNRLARLGLPQ